MVASAAEVLNTACAFERMHVETTDGRRLGHVFDLRCRWEPGTEGPVLEAIVYGRLGLLERVGLITSTPQKVAWAAVRELRGRAIVIDAEAARESPP